MGTRYRPKWEFSKLILIFETLLVAYVSHRVLRIAEMAVLQSFEGGLPYLVTFITVVWAAYGTSVSFYYNKAKSENTLKITGSTEVAKAQVLAETAAPINDTPDI